MNVIGSVLTNGRVYRIPSLCVIDELRVQKLYFLFFAAELLVVTIGGWVIGLLALIYNRILGRLECRDQVFERHFARFLKEHFLDENIHLGARKIRQNDIDRIRIFKNQQKKFII